MTPRNGAKRQKAPKAKYPARRCRNCDESFYPTREWNDFCSDACRKEFWRHGGVSISRILPTIEDKIDAHIENALAPIRAELTRLRGR